MASVVQPSSENPKPLSSSAQPFTPPLTCKAISLPPPPQVVYQLPSLQLQKLQVASLPTPYPEMMVVMGMSGDRGVWFHRSNWNVLYPHLPLLEYAGFNVCNPRLMLHPASTTKLSEFPPMIGNNIVDGKCTGKGEEQKVEETKKSSVKRVVLERPRELKGGRGGAVWVPKKSDINSNGGGGAALERPVEKVHQGPLNFFGRGKTTFMIRNIPNKMRRDELLEILDNHCRQENENAMYRSDPVRSAFDFVYLPIDFK